MYSPVGLYDEISTNQEIAQAVLLEESMALFTPVGAYRDGHSSAMQALYDTWASHDRELYPPFIYSESAEYRSAY